MHYPKITRIKDIIEKKIACPAEKMLENAYQQLGHEQFSARETFRHSISNLDAWEKEKKEVKHNLLKAIGGSLPNEKVKIKLFREFRKKDVLIKNLLFSPFADHWVSANLYLPLNANKVPAVILPPGHDQTGKIAYRERAILFVKNGYAALTFDYIGGGERNILDKNGDIFSFTSAQHNLIGNRMNLYGYNLQWFMIAETVAAIDLVSLQPEIDSEKICITGSSGGGTETLFTTALDERIKVSAPAACIHSSCNNIDIDDTEQVFYNMIPTGLDYPDIASFLIAPRPMLTILNKKDIWGMEKVDYFVNEVNSAYTLHHAAAKFSQSIWDRGHEYQTDQVAVTIKWFNRWLDNDTEFISPETITEDDIPSEAECQVTEKNNLFLSGFSTPLQIFSNYLEKKYTKSFIINEKIIEDYIAKNVHDENLKNPTKWEEIDTYQIEDFTGKRILFSPEKNVWLPFEILIPEKIKGIMLLLDDIPRMSNIEWMINCASKGYLAVLPDIRGFGDTESEDSWSDKENWTQNIYDGKRYNLSALVWTIGRNIMFDRVRDISALIDVLQLMGYNMDITLHGKKIGALIGLFTALANRKIKTLHLENSLNSYKEHIASNFPLSWGDELIHNILGQGIDIPDIRKYLLKFCDVTINEMQHP